MCTIPSLGLHYINRINVVPSWSTRVQVPKKDGVVTLLASSFMLAHVPSQVSCFIRRQLSALPNCACDRYDGISIRPQEAIQYRLCIWDIIPY